MVGTVLVKVAGICVAGVLRVGFIAVVVILRAAETFSLLLKSLLYC